MSFSVTAPHQPLPQPSQPVYGHWDLERINQELRMKDIMILVGKWGVLSRTLAPSC